VTTRSAFSPGKAWSGLRRRARRRLTPAGLREVYFTKYNSRPFRHRPVSLRAQPLPRNAPRLVQVAHFHQNAGDALLPIALRDLFSTVYGPVDWRGQHVARVVDEGSRRSFASARGIVVGGGGLFLRDTNPNSLSGWQWSCSVDSLRALPVPVVLFAVGYNRFRGQPDFEPVFSEHLTELAQRAPFLGMRNGGSVRAVRQYLPPELHDQVRFQPCPTTLCSRIYPTMTRRSSRVAPFVALNCAFDRRDLRFGDDEHRVLDGIAGAIAALHQVVEVKVFAHHPSDEQVLPALARHGVRAEVVRLYEVPGDVVLRNYSNALFSIGMRGHAQLIPFGCGRPIVSLVSHDKMWFLLDDIEHCDWGVEVQDPDLEAKLLQIATGHLDHLDEVQAEVAGAQQRFWDVTYTNLGDLDAAWGLATPRAEARGG